MVENNLTRKLQDILYDDWKKFSVANKLREAKKVLGSANDISEEEAEVLCGWKNLEDFFFDEKGLGDTAEFYLRLVKKFPKQTILAVAMANYFYQQGKKEEAVKLLLDVYKKDTTKVSVSPAELDRTLRSYADRAARVKFFVSSLQDIERNKGIRVARKEYKNLQEQLPKEDAYAVWKYIVGNKLIHLMRPEHQPDYLIVYDEMWGKIIESYFIRKSDVSEEDEPDDTMNGPIEKERRDEFIKVLNERYPEKERFKIRIVGADSIESIKADIKWVVED